MAKLRSGCTELGMHVGVSALFLRPGRVGGAEHFVGGMVAGLALAPAAERVTVFHPRGCGVGTGHDAQRVRQVSMWGADANRFVEEATVLPWRARGLEAMIFPNYFTPPVFPAARILTVIMDLQYLHLPENFSKRKRVWLRMAHEVTLRRADAVVVTSEFVRSDVLARYGERWVDKLHVVPAPISWERWLTPAVGELPLGLGETRYVLSVSAHYAHKNLETLLRAFARVVRSDPDLRLVLVGQNVRLLGVVRTARVSDVVDELNLGASVVITGYVDDATLGKLYGQATAVVVPSLFEGFGMPAVEALGLRVPVICANRTSLPEVTRGLALLLDEPTDPAEMATAIIEVLRRSDDYRPSEQDAAALRRWCAPDTVATRYLDLLARGVA